MVTAQVLIDGAGQTVHLPPESHIDATEVFVKQVGRSLVLVPTNADPWQLLHASLDQFSDDFMADRAQPPQQQREDWIE